MSAEDDTPAEELVGKTRMTAVLETWGGTALGAVRSSASLMCLHPPSSPRLGTGLEPEPVPSAPGSPRAGQGLRGWAGPVLQRGELGWVRCFVPVHTQPQRDAQVGAGRQ